MSLPPPRSSLSIPAALLQPHHGTHLFHPFSLHLCSGPGTFPCVSRSPAPRTSLRHPHFTPFPSTTPSTITLQRNSPSSPLHSFHSQHSRPIPALLPSKLTPARSLPHTRSPGPCSPLPTHCPPPQHPQLLIPSLDTVVFPPAPPDSDPGHCAPFSPEALTPAQHPHTGPEPPPQHLHAQTTDPHPSDGHPSTIPDTDPHPNHGHSPQPDPDTDLRYLSGPPGADPTPTSQPVTDPHPATDPPQEP